VFDTEPGTGFGVDLGDNDWAAQRLVTSLHKVRLRTHRSRFDVQALTEVNNMLFKIQLVSELGPCARGLTADLTNLDEVRDLMTRAAPVDVLVASRRWDTAGPQDVGRL